MPTMSKLRNLVLGVSLSIVATGAANAGHLFSQGGGGPVSLAAGNSMQFTINSLNSSIGSAVSARVHRFDFYFNNASWGAGDSLRVVTPSGSTFDFVSGALPSGSGENTSFLSLTNGGANPILSPSAYSSIIPDNVAGTTWRIDALSGAFDLSGFVFDTYDGTQYRQTAGNDADESGPFSTPAQVAEPGVVAILGLGLVGLTLVRRKRAA